MYMSFLHEKILIQIFYIPKSYLLKINSPLMQYILYNYPSPHSSSYASTALSPRSTPLLFPYIKEQACKKQQQIMTNKDTIRQGKVIIAKLDRATP